MVLSELQGNGIRNLTPFMADHGYKKFSSDHYVFIKMLSNVDFIILLFYINDMLLFYINDMSILEILHKKIQKHEGVSIPITTNL